MLHWRHTTLDILVVLPQNHGSWKFENGYLCIFHYFSSLYAGTWSKAHSLVNFQLGGDWDTIWWGGVSKSDWHTCLCLVIYCFQVPEMEWRNGWIFNAGLVIGTQWKIGTRSKEGNEQIISLDLCASHFDVRFIDVIRSRPTETPQKFEINEWIHWILYLVSAMSPFNVNPIFAVHVVKSSQDFRFCFTRQVSFWMRNDSLWANGAKVWLFQGPFGAISCSWNLLFPCARSLWSTVACRWIPSSPFKTSMLCTDPAKPWPRYQRLSFLDMVRVTLARYHRSRTSTICRGKPHQFFEKILQSVYSAMSSNMFGASWAFTTASNLLLTKKTHPPWISDFLHCGTRHRRHDVPNQELCIDGVPSGAGPTRLQK